MLILKEWKSGGSGLGFYVGVRGNLGPKEDILI